MNKAVELFRRHPFRSVVLLGFAALTVFFLLNTVGFLGSSWDACEDARIRQREAQTDTMFRYARADVEKFCPPDEARPTAIPPTATMSVFWKTPQPRALSTPTYGEIRRRANEYWDNPAREPYMTPEPTPRPTWPPVPTATPAPTATPYVPLKVGSTASIITGRGTQLGYGQVTDCAMTHQHWTPVAQGTKVTIVDSALSCDPWPDRYQVRLPDDTLLWFTRDQLTQ